MFLSVSRDLLTSFFLLSHLIGHKGYMMTSNAACSHVCVCVCVFMYSYDWFYATFNTALTLQLIFFTLEPGTQKKV